ncbi:MAG: hypothetical protein ACD_2C00077G0001 [uncultured bacterium (gcode 4)]|uniref:Integron gene cassette protein n=1 Tax=uncultured bacterium (gcode 4) TaxID=1234023 RepID=K2FFC3_9BACT|nr:MAG: hypothetical protein ACD_2C00077G0001 [uncultured bacterium (gcode 4)]
MKTVRLLLSAILVSLPFTANAATTQFFELTTRQIDCGEAAVRVSKIFAKYASGMSKEEISGQNNNVNPKTIGTILEICENLKKGKNDITPEEVKDIIYEDCVSRPWRLLLVLSSYPINAFLTEGN